jgi:hypothetical protein
MERRLDLWSQLGEAGRHSLGKPEDDRPRDGGPMSTLASVIQALLGEAHLSMRASSSDSPISSHVQSATRPSVCQCTSLPVWIAQATSKTQAEQ